MTASILQSFFILYVVQYAVRSAIYVVISIGSLATIPVYVPAIFAIFATLISMAPTAIPFIMLNVDTVISDAAFIVLNGFLISPTIPPKYEV